MKQKIIHFISLVFLLAACSTRKNGFFNRHYHQTTAQYNVLFNSKQAYEEGLNSLKNNYKDDYSEILSLTGLPEIKQDSMELIIPGLTDISLGNPQKQSKSKTSIVPPSTEYIGLFGRKSPTSSESSNSGFQKAEIKAIKIIKDHSMVIKGKERNNKIPEAFLVLGRARYFQGKSFSALEAFNHIKQHYKNTPHFNQAQLWIAKVEAQTKNYYSALEILKKLSKKKKLKKDLQEKIATIQTEILIKQKKYNQAIETLKKCLNLTRDNQKKTRYNYVQGQLYVRSGDMKNALNKFQYITQNSSDSEFGFRAKMALAHNFDPKIQDYDNLTDYLKKLLKDDKYYNLQDQIYYSLASAAKQSGKKEEAQFYYQKALDQKTNSASDVRSNIYRSMGDVLFQNGEYIEAANYYDSALAILPSNETKTLLAQKRENMKPVIENYTIVEKNDSILAVVYMNPEKRKNFFQKHVDQLKYLEKIQQEPAIIDSLKHERNEAELKLGIAYLEKLQDRQAAIKSLENLLTKNPDDSLKIRVYYNLYKAYKKIQPSQAEIYKNKVIKEFNSSLYAKYLINPKSEDFSKESVPNSIKMYVQAYKAFRSEDMTRFEKHYKEIKGKFPKDRIISKLLLLKAMVEGKTKGKTAFMNILNSIIVQYPETEEAEKAREILATLQARMFTNNKEE